jgi:hypothetical protein
MEVKSMAKTILIGCRLPNGLVLQVGKNPNRVTIDGVNKSNIIGANFMTTEVDESFWLAWKAENSDFKPLKSGAIFEASSPREATDKAKELKGEKTGFEQIDKDGPLMKSLGLTPA